MISDALQERIHCGDRDAFRALYSEYSRDVYLTACEVLKDEALARAVVKQVFLRIYRELLDASGPINTDERIDELTNEEIRVQRIVAGDTGSDVLKTVHTPRRIERRSEPTDTDAFTRLKERYAENLPAIEIPKKQPYHGGMLAVSIVLLVLFLLLLLWIVAGFLMSMDILPAIDLGYSWFNEAILPLFDLT